MDKKYEMRIKKSVTYNIIIVALTIIATIIMFSGFKFMKYDGPLLESTNLEMFKFFTVDSNLFMGVISLLFLLDEIKLLKGKIKEISKYMYILKLVATTAVALTFFVVFAYLGPISSGGLYSMILNSNLFFHLFIPVISMYTFILFEKTNKIEFRQTFYILVPTILYSLFYLINVLLHIENGKVSPVYDWYWFVQNGIWTSIIVAPLILIIDYIIGILLWKLNQKNNI